MTANTAIGQTTPVAVPTLLPNERRGEARLPWQQSPATAAGGEAGKKQQNVCKLQKKKKAKLLPKCPDLEEERQVTVSQIKIPPTGQHAVNHLDKSQQKRAGSAPFWRQVGELDGDCGWSRILQETQRKLDCRVEVQVHG